MYQPYARWYKGKAQWFFKDWLYREIGPFNTFAEAEEDAADAMVLGS